MTFLDLVKEGFDIDISQNKKFNTLTLVFSKNNRFVKQEFNCLEINGFSEAVDVQRLFEDRVCQNVIEYYSKGNLLC